MTFRFSLSNSFLPDHFGSNFCLWRVSKWSQFGNQPVELSCCRTTQVTPIFPLLLCLFLFPRLLADFSRNESLTRLRRGARRIWSRSDCWSWLGFYLQVASLNGNGNLLAWMQKENRQQQQVSKVCLSRTRFQGGSLMDLRPMLAFTLKILRLVVVFPSASSTNRLLQATNKAKLSKVFYDGNLSGWKLFLSSALYLSYISLMKLLAEDFLSLIGNFVSFSSDQVEASSVLPLEYALDSSWRLLAD